MSIHISNRELSPSSVSNVRPTNKEKIVLLFCEFLEVFIYCILYSRETYPPNLFEKRKKWGQTIFIPK